MQCDVIFKTFRTYRHPYVYDRHTNLLIMLEEHEYQELVEVERGAITSDRSNVIKRFQSQGYLEPNTVTRIEHSSTSLLDSYVNTRVRQLILQVTQQCNLRCEYCTYSGIYENRRTHSGQSMSVNTAERAIDLLIKQSSTLQTVYVSFYGGEPLLEFNLIRHCVDYLKRLVEGKTIKYSLTTNGTLLTDEVVDFLADNCFQLAISLDGTKEDHDANRRFIDGRGSFDVIYQNLVRINERYPEYMNEISIMSTLNPCVDLAGCIDYFRQESLFSPVHVMFNQIMTNQIKKAPVYEKSFHNVSNYEYVKMLLSLVGKTNDVEQSSVHFRTMESIRDRFRNMQKSTALGQVAHHNGPCEPGLRRLFVRFDGAFFPCERVNDSAEHMRIGSLEKGLDVKQIKAILNIGKLTENECITCWCLRQCAICAALIDSDTGLSRKLKLSECERNHKKALHDLHEIAVLKEFGFTIENMRIG